MGYAHCKFRDSFAKIFQTSAWDEYEMLVCLRPHRGRYVGTKIIIPTVLRKPFRQRVGNYHPPPKAL